MGILSKNIGEKILEKLFSVDLIAYIRFASVYKKFSDISTFMDELKKLKKEHVKKQKKIKNFNK